MQEVKKQYQRCISGAKAILESNGFSTDELTALSSQIDAYKVIIPMVGMFSVGKSALLNALMGKDILPTDTSKTTSIATELHFSLKERVEAYKLEAGENNIMKEILLDEFPLDILKTPQKLDPQKYSFVKAYIDNTYLEQQLDIVLVDMPGLDSGLENHDRAIRQYIRQATNYIFVESKLAGTLTTTATAFLKEITSYGFKIYVIINQIDQVSEDGAIENIKEKMFLFMA